MPDVDHLVDTHVAEIVRAADPVRVVSHRATRAGRTSSRRPRLVAVGVALAAFIALPSMALAGVLPDPVQRAAARIADTVGVRVPLPERASDDAREATKDIVRGPSSSTTEQDAASPKPDSGRGRGDATRGDATRGDATRGTVPGTPAPGEQRGNRFGQVPGGPDQGKAAPHSSSNGSRGSGKPADAPGQSSKPSTPKPAQSSSSATPAAPVAGGAGGAGGNGNGNGASGGGGKPARG